MKEKVLDHWSYSAWSSAKGCAFKFYRKYILGEKEPGNAAMARGTMIHAKAEHFLKGNIPTVPSELKRFKTEYNALRASSPIVEQFWGVSASWQFMDRKSWCVMKMDAAVAPSKADGSLYIQDLKTGRKYSSHKKQAALYAAIGYAKFPDIDVVETEFWYSDSGETLPLSFSATRLKREIEFWKEQGEFVIRPRKKYLPEPSDDSCRYCHLRTDKGGPCDAWRTLR
jgi:hypothetical protein